MKTIFAAAIAAATVLSVAPASAELSRAQAEAVRIHNESAERNSDRIVVRSTAGRTNFVTTKDTLSRAQLIAIRINNQSAERYSDIIRVK